MCTYKSTSERIKFHKFNVKPFSLFYTFIFFLLSKNQSFLHYKYYDIHQTNIQLFQSPLLRAWYEKLYELSEIWNSHRSTRRRSIFPDFN